MEQHLALYRKWRPLTFDDVFGQEHVTAALRSQVEQGRTSHAYLFTGTRGTGKTTCAKILARAVCCERPIHGSPCNTCAACQSILEESALDVSEIDAASNNGVDNIRDIREESTFSPTALKKRVYIIDEVHMLSSGAFNALLKTLEEPPEHVLFILATTEIHKVPATILSRCQRYDFRRIPPEVIAARLSQIATEEGFALEGPAAALLSRLGDGSMRDAISLLDRSASASNAIGLSQVTQALGIPSGETVAAVYQAVLEKDGVKVLELFTDCYLDGQDLVSLFDQLLSLLRDLYVLKATGKPEYLLSTGADPALLQQLATQTPTAELEYFVGCVSDLLTRFTRTAIKRTDCEMCLLKLCLRGEVPIPFAPASAGTSSQTAVLQPVSPASTKLSAPTSHNAPPWDDAPSPKAVPAPTPQKSNQNPLPPRRTAAVSSGGDSAVRDAFLEKASGKVSSAVRTYLKLSDMEAHEGVLYIACREESMIFMKKPAVQEVLTEAAQACGYTAVNIRKQGEPLPNTIKAEEQTLADPLADILARAKALGVEVSEKG